MNAHIGIRLELLGSPEPGVDLPGRHLPDQVGLRPGGGRLAAVGAIARAHPHGRLEAAALAASVAGRRHRHRARARPAEDREDGRGGRIGPVGLARLRGLEAAGGLEPWGGLRDPDQPGAGPRVQPRERGDVGGGGRGQGRERLDVVCRQVGILADHLAGIEQIRWVEGVLDLAEDLDELPVLPGQELGPRQAAALRRGDRPPGGQDDVIDLARDPLEPGPVRRGRPGRGRAGGGSSAPA